MKNEQILLLLNEFVSVQEPISANDCAKLLNISLSSLKKDIRNMKSELQEHGCQIEGKTGYGNGYELQVLDEVKFKKYLHEVLPEEIRTYDANYNEQKNRIRYIINYLLNTNTYVKSDELADSLCISRSQFSKDLALVKDYFKNYDIALVNKPHYGIKIAADEVSIRMCFANTYMNSIDFIEDDLIYIQPNVLEEKDLHKIRTIILECADAFGYRLTDISMENLVIHLFIAIKRVKEEKTIVMDEETRKQVLQEKEYVLAQQIVERMEHEFHVCFDDEEICYIIMHLSAKRMVSNDALNSEVMEIIDEMLKRIKEKFYLDITNNLDLRITLGLHTIPLLKRVKYQIVFKNPLLKEIRSNLMFAYDIALCACEVIHERYGVMLSADEVGYYALHFKVALDNSKAADKKNILLVCSSGRGTSQLLKVDFMKKFADQIEVLETCNAFELSRKDLSSFDCVFTTVPIYVRLPIPVFKIKYFLDSDSERQVAKVLQRDTPYHQVMDCFAQDLFHTDIKGNTKEEVIQEIVGKIKRKRKLPKGFLASIMRREALEDTQFLLIATPHSDGVICEENIISFNILKKPIVWGSGSVQIVILMSFAKGFIKHNDAFFDFLHELVKSKYLVNKLVSQPSYETLKETVQELYRKEI